MFNPRRKLFLVIGISLVVLIFWGWVLIRLLRQVKNAGITLRELEGKIVELEAKRKEAGDIQTLLQDRAEDLAKINSFSVNKERPVIFIEDLEDAARKTQNRVIIDFDEGRSRDKNIFFRLTIEGSKDSVLKYLKLLEFMPYQIKVEEMAWQKLAAAGVSALVKLPQEAEAPLSHRLEILIKVETL